MERLLSFTFGSGAMWMLTCSIVFACGKSATDDTGAEGANTSVTSTSSEGANGPEPTQSQTTPPTELPGSSAGGSGTSGGTDELHPDANPSASSTAPRPSGSQDGAEPGAGGQDSLPSDSAAPAMTGPSASEANTGTDNPGPSGSDAAPESSTVPPDSTVPPAGPAPEWKEAFPSFTSHDIAQFQGGYYTAIFDVDGDDLPDVLGLSSGAAGLVWFKNPTWEKYTITTGTERFICAAPYDVDDDGDIDLAFASEFDLNDSNNGGTIYWAEAPDDPTANEEWTLHAVDEIPTSHRVRFADIDGDGKKELLVLPIFGIGSSAPSHAGAVRLTAYWIGADPTAAWESEVLDDTRLEVAHGISVVDWDGDDAEDVLTAANDGVDLFRPGLEMPVQHVGAGKEGSQPDRGSSEVGLGYLGADRFVAAIEPWHGTDMVIYTPGTAPDAEWAREVIGTDFEHGHGMAIGDFNSDGFDEVVGGGGQGDLVQLIYRYLPSSGSWETIELDIGGVAVSGIEVADMDGDGDLDIVTIGGSPTNNVVWYENAE